MNKFLKIQNASGAKEIFKLKERVGTIEEFNPKVGKKVYKMKKQGNKQININNTTFMGKFDGFVHLKIKRQSTKYKKLAHTQQMHHC